MITLVSADCEYIAVDRKTIKQSRVLDCISVREGQVVPVRDVEGRALGNAMEYCAHHKNRTDMIQAELGNHRPDEWEGEFVLGMSRKDRDDLIIAARALDIPGLGRLLRKHAQDGEKEELQEEFCASLPPEVFDKQMRLVMRALHGDGYIGII